MTDTTFTSPLAAPPPVGLDPSAPFEPLAALRDIHLPEPVGFWPLAPGWWMLLGLLVVLALIAGLLEWRRRQTLGYQAVQALKAIGRDRTRYADARAVAAEAALLMRRVLVSQDSRSEAAALVGEGWRRFLSQGRAGLPAEVGAFIAEAPYLPQGLPDAERVDRAQVVSSVTRWIRGNT